LIEGLESCITMLNHQLKDRIIVIKKFNPIPEIVCNPGKLNQVFMNVITNAIQSISGEGTITIYTFFENNSIHIKISDSGTGISESIISRIFEPFFTTKKVGKGTGLGLSISFGIIKEHHGQIFYNNNAGKGATCTIILPMR
ncbi:histidine kinase, partial [bacterium]|nr:histidine kinase [bacterium]